MIHLVLLSGGSGTRLWPLSNSARSKQFLKVLRDGEGNHVSMVQRVFSQVRAVDAEVDVTVATSANQKDALERQLQGGYELVLEPERRDTAPAIMLACAHLAGVQGADAGDTVVVMPIDSYAGQGYFDNIARLDSAVQAGASELVLMGVSPTRPTDKYGYIVPEGEGRAGSGGALPVREFREKPDMAAAQGLIAEGALWNCGVFAFRLGWLLDILAGYLPGEGFEEVYARYGELPKNSFDYEVVERARSVSVIPYSGPWKDLGTWNTLTEEMAEPTSGRVAGIGTCANTHAINELGIPLVAVGLEDAVVVAAHDGIFVASKEQSHRMKEFLGEAASARPMYERRRWGEYRVLDKGEYGDGRRSLTKELVLEEGCQFSYQVHRHRDEVWTVVSGHGEVVVDGEVRPVAAGDAVRVPVDTPHSCRALGGPLRIIEVQMGDLLEEEDIERIGDYWNGGGGVSR